MNDVVMVTYAWNRVGYNIIKSLYSEGYKIVVGDTSRHNICSNSKYCYDSFTYSDPVKDEDNFIKDLLINIEKYKPFILIPTHDEGTVIAKHINEFPSDLIIPIESYQKMTLLSDKYESTHLAMKLGIPCPTVFHEVENIPQYPIVLKTKIGNSAKTVFFPTNKFDACSLVEKYGLQNILMEEFVEGRDYSVDCLRKGDVFISSCYKAIMTKTKGGGTSTQRQIVDMPILQKYAKIMLDFVDYNGVCGFDFKVNESTGEAYFIEINTRYTGGLATPIVAGFNIPVLHLKLFKNEKIEIPDIKVGVKTKWILGDIITLVTRIVHHNLTKDEFMQIISKKFDGFDDYEKEDKKAFRGEVLYYFHKLIINGKLNP